MNRRLKIETGNDEVPETGSELDLTEDQFVTHHNNIIVKKRAADVEKEKVKAAQAIHNKLKAEHKQARDRAKADGMSLAEYDYAQELLELDDPRVALRRVLRLVTYLNHGGLEMEAIMEEASKDPYEGVPTHEADRLNWESRGFIIGKSGREITIGEIPPGATPDQYSWFVRGFDAGKAEYEESLSRAGPLFEAGADNKNPENGSEEQKKERKAKADKMQAEAHASIKASAVH